MGPMATDQILHKGEYLALILRDGYECVQRVKGTGVVAMVPLTGNGEIVLVEQYRMPHQRTVVEIPAGLVADEPQFAGEGLEATARRELLEETGFEATHLRRLGEWPTSAGMTSETVVVYLATGLKRVGAGGGDASENIQVHIVPLDVVDPWLAGKERDGCFIDPKVYAALHFAALERGKP